MEEGELEESLASESNSDGFFIRMSDPQDDFQAEKQAWEIKLQVETCKSQVSESDRLHMMIIPICLQ